MREIKFRAWNGGEMQYNFNPHPFTFSTFGNPIMQFTGLKDKKGNEIYEGDIVEAIANHHGEETDIKFNAKIIYNDYIGQFQISYYNHHNKFVNDDIWLKYFLEVIGNIYENPRLLK